MTHKTLRQQKTPKSAGLANSLVLILHSHALDVFLLAWLVFHVVSPATWDGRMPNTKMQNMQNDARPPPGALHALDFGVHFVRCRLGVGYMCLPHRLPHPECANDEKRCSLTSALATWKCWIVFGMQRGPRPRCFIDLVVILFCLGASWFGIVLLDWLLLLHGCGTAPVNARTCRFIVYMSRSVLGPHMLHAPCAPLSCHCVCRCGS